MTLLDAFLIILIPIFAVSLLSGIGFVVIWYQGYRKITKQFDGFDKRHRR